MLKNPEQILYFVLAGAALAGFFKLYSSRLLKVKNELAKKVSKRTEELNTLNSELKGKIIELDKVAQNLTETNRLRERLLNILSHDVHSPLRFSTMVGKAVLTKKEELSKEEIIDALTDINQTSIRILLLISNILNWVEYQKQNFTPRFTIENVHQMVQDKMEFFRFMAESKNIKLVNSIPVDAVIRTDKTAFGVIIQNLLNNAVKFTPDGEIEVNAHAGDSNFILTIADTGNGMPKESIDAINYSQAIIPLIDTENLRGNGLGWGLIKELLDPLNGTFEIKSGEGTGTTVTLIFLPV